MNRWVLAATTTAMLAALAGCNSDSDNDDAVVEPPAAVTPDSINLSFLGRYSAGIFAESAAEIPAFDPVNKRIFLVNAQKGAVDVLDATDPANPTLIDTLTAADVAADAVVNSIAYKGGYLAVAIEASPKTDNGFVALYDATTLELLGSAQVGAQPDMLTFSPDGQYLLTANEGEPNNDYSVDPVGSISILSLTDDEIVEVRTATFSSFNARRDELIQAGVLGDVKEVHIWTDRPIWPQGIGRPSGSPPVPKNVNWDLWLGPAPYREYGNGYLPFAWRGWWDFGTGNFA